MNSIGQGKDHRGAAGQPGHAGTRVAAMVSILMPLALSLAFAWQIPVIADGGNLRISQDWMPSLGITLSFYLDGLSLTFALLISGIGTLVTLYSSAYLISHDHYQRFVLYLLAFMGSMLGLVLADNLITLFVFWELTTVTSYLLIGFDHAAAKARRNALQALLVTATGGLALLAGFILIGSVAGSYELSEILNQGDVLRDHGAYLPILILVLLGAFTKSAQVPFHFWLPNAMAAPTPVSAYLHSATMVKAGIYLLARLHPALSGTDVWIWTLTLFGATTAVFASILALRQSDLKLVLAYTTVMALGTLTMFLGADSRIAIAAAVTFLIVHSLYKAALFLVVGIIDHRTGTRDTAKLRGLAQAMPVTALAAALAAFSMAGFPPFLGFIGKELKYEGALAIASEPVFVAAAAVLANALMVAVAGIVALRPFYGQTRQTPKLPREAPPAMWFGPALLAALGLIFGLAPALIAQSLVEPAVAAITGQAAEVSLALWHGLNLPLLLSLVTFALGVAIYLCRARLQELLSGLADSLPYSADRFWDRLLEALKAFAGLQTRLLQGGVLRRYLFIVFSSMVLVLAFTLLRGENLLPDLRWPEAAFKHWAVVVLIAAAAIMTALASSRLAAICALGVVGVGVALLFVMFGAPDVAITQLLVETLVVVLVAVVMLRLPSLNEGRSGKRRVRRCDAALSLALGGLVTVVLLAVVQTPLDRSLTSFFETASVPEAYGRNIVNVILVDFRALDTFGEIAVVAVAALGAYALIRNSLRRKAP